MSRIKCMACPDYESADREAYRDHCSTKWHQYNTNERMMGRTTLTEAQYLAKFAPPPEPVEVKEQSPITEVEADAVSVCVVFRHNEEKWSHTFRIPRGWGILSFGILGVSLESQSARNHGDGCEEEHGQTQ
eukprot:symbB.v1.2.027606.t1/scaffold2843.1/size69054/4